MGSEGGTRPLAGMEAVVAGLYAGRRSKLRRFVRGIVKGDGDAEDIVQEAFARLIFTLRDGEVENPEAFLYTAARNLAVDSLRSRSRRSVVEVGCYDEETAPASANSEAGMDARIQLLHISRAIERFPAKSRNLFLRRKLLGQSYKEIARDTKIAVSTIEKHVAHCMFACRQLAS